VAELSKRYPSESSFQNQRGWFQIALFCVLKMKHLKPIRLTLHARLRMLKYRLSEEEVAACLRNPDKVVSGYKGRRIANKIRNKYVIRAIYEENELITVVAVYLAWKSRYERGT
jgi:hypothetical protein